MNLSLGQKITEFTTLATGNKTLTKADFEGRKVVLFFYPKDNTPGCTSEVQAFRDHYDAFSASGTLIFGISRDSLRSHENFRENHQLPFDLICDADETLCNLFDVIKLKKMYGKEYLGIERSTFLIDRNGVIQHEWRKVRIKGHVEDVLQAAQTVG